MTAGVHPSVADAEGVGLVAFAFFSCGLAIQAAAARLIYSYARDRALPGSTALAGVSRRFRTPVSALVVAAVLPALFAVLARFSPSSNISIGFITIPANVNALLLLVSFAVSGIYLSFLLVIIASLIARLRGWQPRGVFRLGAWAYPVTFAGIVWLGGMLVNILIPSGVTSPRGVLFNYDWMTLLVMVVIIAIGAVYSIVSRPARRIPVVAPPTAEAAT
jgi:amino acid transporter